MRTWYRCGWPPRIAASPHRRIVGRALVYTVLDWARTKEARAIYLAVACNNDTAIMFYRSLGFSFTGGTKLYPNDPDLFEYEMIRQI